MMENLNHYKNRKKEWTVLVYANGNNDLAPEIYQGFKKIEKEYVCDDVNVIFQLAIAPHKLVNTLRLNVSFQACEYEGVRRYKINHEEATMVDDLGDVNMADPVTLSDFIIWGIKNYPSKHIMVILSGHGAGFAGAMNDYTHDYPYIMSISGLTQAIYRCKKNTGKNIDCLVLDTCYMNLVEVLYEFACIYNQPVKYLITPLKNMALEGLPCHLLIRYLQDMKNHKLKIRDTLVNLVKDINKEASIFHRIMAVDIKKKPFIRLKKGIDKMADFVVKNHINLVDELTDWYCYRASYPLISILGLDNTLANKFSEIYPKGLNIEKSLEPIVIYPLLGQLSRNQNLGPSLYLPADTNQYLALKEYYDSLSFSKDNRWIQILQGKKSNEENNNYKSISIYDPLPPPTPMPIGSVVAVILEQNPGLTQERGWQIVKKLGWY